jgi:hypothetical protein
MPSRIIRTDADFDALGRTLSALDRPYHVSWDQELRRSDQQNRKMWAMIRDISNAKPEGRTLTPDEWKCVFMQACGWEVHFLEGLDGRPFPAGFRSSKMKVKQMADLITFIQAKGDEWGVRWKEAKQYD